MLRCWCCGVAVAKGGYRTWREGERLQARAERLAGVFGLSVAGFREVRVDWPAGETGQMPRAMAAARAETVPPAAEPQEVLLTASVEGEAILLRR